MVVRFALIHDYVSNICWLPVSKGGCRRFFVCLNVLLIATAFNHSCQTETVSWPCVFNIVVSPDVVLGKRFNSERQFWPFIKGVFYKEKHKLAVGSTCRNWLSIACGIGNWERCLVVNTRLPKMPREISFPKCLITVNECFDGFDHFLFVLITI